MLGSVFAADFTLPELLHHLGVFLTLCLVKPIAVVFKKLIRGLERSSLVSVNKGMIAGDGFGIAGRKRKEIRLAKPVDSGVGQAPILTASRLVILAIRPQSQPLFRG